MSSGIGDAGAGRADSRAIATTVLQVGRNIWNASVQESRAELLSLAIELLVRHLIVAVVRVLISRVSPCLGLYILKD